MPIVRKCGHSTCAEIVVDRTHCDTHRPTDYRQEYSAWYSLAVWRGRYGLRRKKLAYSPICEKCGRVAATDVDHKIPFAGDWSLFTKFENLQSLCASCHSEKTATETNAKKAGTT